MGPRQAGSPRVDGEKTQRAVRPRIPIPFCDFERSNDRKKKKKAKWSASSRQEKEIGKRGSF